MAYNEVTKKQNANLGHPPYHRRLRLECFRKVKEGVCRTVYLASDCFTLSMKLIAKVIST